MWSGDLECVIGIFLAIQVVENTTSVLFYKLQKSDLHTQAL